MYSPAVDRRVRLLAELSLGEPGLEIGPLDRPLVRQEDGPVEYVDHLDREGLREAYAKDPTVDLKKLVEVDHVWAERPLTEVVSGRTFAYVVASHGIEHVPDVVGWLRELASVLKPGGILSRAVPDKRFTFDVDRPSSTLGECLEAEALGLRKPSLR